MHGSFCLNILMKKWISYYETDDKSEIKQFLYDNCIDGMEFSVRYKMQKQ